VSDPTTTHETKADLLGAVPITLLMKRGQLRLADGRLSFTRSNNRVVFDAPMSEIHSVDKSSFGITLWHGTTRYRFAIGQKYRAGASSGIPLVAEVAAVGAIEDYRDARLGADVWVSMLRPLAGPAPQGVEVKASWPTWKTMLVILGGACIIVFGIVAIALIV
jgi:hypothetical protein